MLHREWWQKTCTCDSYSWQLSMEFITFRTLVFLFHFLTFPINMGNIVQMSKFCWFLLLIFFLIVCSQWQDKKKVIQEESFSGCQNIYFLNKVIFFCLISHAELSLHVSLRSFGIYLSIPFSPSQYLRPLFLRSCWLVNDTYELGIGFKFTILYIYIYKAYFQYYYFILAWW